MLKMGFFPPDLRSDGPKATRHKRKLGLRG